MSERDQARELLFSRMLLTVWAVLSFYTVVYFVIGAYFSALSVCFGVVLFCPLAWWLNTKGQKIAARVLFLATGSLYIYLTGLGFEGAIHAEYYYLPAAMMGLLILDTSRVHFFLIGIFFPVVMWGCSVFLRWQVIPDSWIFSFPYTTEIGYLNFFLAYFVAILFLRMMIDQILVLNDQLRLKNELLLQREASLSESQFGMKQEAERLLISEKKFQALFEEAPIGIFQLDEHFFFLEANQTYQKWLGYSLKDLKGKNFFDVLSQEHQVEMKFFLEQLRKDQGSLKYHSAAFLNPTGACVLGEMGVRFTSLGGQKQSFFVSVKDVTELKNLERSLEVERTKSIQNAKLASLGELAAGVAHEINNPLAVMEGSLHLLCKYKKEETKFESYVDTIQKSMTRISKIVLGLKKFSRISSQQKTSIKISFILNEVLNLVSHYAERHQVSLSFDLKSNASILCDEIQIEQVFVNLINNAVDAVKNEKEKWIKVKNFEEENTVVVQIFDSGSGVPLAAKEKIFDPFFTTKKIGEGTGLGLSISRGIIDSHQGSLSLREGTPTCFEIKLPIVEQVV